MAQVSLRNVSKIYPGDKGREGPVAVRDFNLEVQDREFVVFVGPSGCGKSTTLRMIAGLEKVSHGEIQIGGRRVDHLPPKDRDIAMVFQNYALYPHMSVYDNLAFGLKLRKFPKAEIKKRVGEAAGILGIEKYLDRKPKALSGGQRQRVAVGRAIVRQPKVFLFDEPLSNLDAKMRVQMRTEIIKLHQRLQATMIYVTHDQVEAMTMGDRIVVMKDGIIQQIDEPIAVYQRPVNSFVAGFLGSPSMNFIKGTIAANGSDHPTFHAQGSCIVCPMPEARSLAGREVLLGIRPEHIEISAPDSGPTYFSALVEMIEATGADTVIYVKTGTQTIICRGHAQLSHNQVGSTMTLHIDSAHTHLFDPATLARIDLPAQQLSDGSPPHHEHARY